MLGPKFVDATLCVQWGVFGISDGASLSGASSTTIRACSLIQAPRSISRQRSLQNGRHGDASVHSTGRLQVGQGTTLGATAASRARCQRERHIRGGLYRSRGGVLPDEETHAAAVVAAADLRVEIRALRQSDADQLHRDIAAERELKDPASRDLGFGLRLLARDPEELRYRVAERPDDGQPVCKVGAPHLVRLVEPVRVVGQVELAGSAGDRAAMLDAFRNSESRSFCRKSAPDVPSSSRMRCILVSNSRSRDESTPGRVPNVDSCAICRSRSLSTSPRRSPREVIARISSSESTAARVDHGSERVW